MCIACKRENETYPEYTHLVLSHESEFRKSNTIDQNRSSV